MIHENKRRPCSLVYICGLFSLLHIHLVKFDAAKE